MVGAGRAWFTGVILLGLLTVASGGCYMGTAGAQGGGDGGIGGDGGLSHDGAVAAASGLPCDVAQVLAPCVSCHVTGGSAPMPLVTYDDLVRPALSDPTKTVAEVSVARMSNTVAPMPPAPAAAASASDIATLSAWIANGYPKGDCGAADAGVLDGSGHDGPVAVPDGGQAGLPCDVAAVLAPCLACHVPSGSAPISLVTYDDLVATSTVDPTKTVAQRCVVRMSATTSPMPPAPNPAASGADIATLQAWIDATYPHGSCDTADGGVVSDPAFTAAPTCTSGTYTYGTNGGAYMHPGGACISCHSTNEGPLYTIAGTVFHTGHEYNDCDGVPAGSVQVVITGADNAVVTLSVNSSGNFHYSGVVARPYTAKVVKGTKVRAMLSPQTSGDCNSCHTQAGANGAPGRIVEPW